MKLKNINQYITEKRTVIKRRYTEDHPSVNINKNARVRNSVLKYLEKHKGSMKSKDFNDYISNFKDKNDNPISKSWIKKNQDLFKYYKDENGVECCKLSNKGTRIAKSIYEPPVTFNVTSDTEI